MNNPDAQEGNSGEEFNDDGRGVQSGHETAKYDIYRKIVERATDGIAMIDAGRIVYVNPIMSRMLGMSQHELMMLNLSDVIADDEREFVLKRYSDRMTGMDIPPTYETRLKRADGTSVPVEINAGVIVKDDRRLDIVFVRDITTRKELTSKLMESEASYKTMAENMPSVVLVHIFGKIAFINKAGKEITGYSEKEMSGKTVFDFMDEPSKAVVQKNMKRRLAGVKVEDYQVTITVKSGENRQLLVRSVPIRYEGNDAILSVLTDMTKRLRAEQELRASEELFRQIGNSANDAIAMSDADGKVIFWNPACEKMFGFSVQEAMGRHYADLIVHPERRAMTKDGQARFQQHGGYEHMMGKPMEMSAVKKDGSEIMIEMSLSVLPHMGKNRSVSVMRDVTERKTAENAKQDRIKKLEKENERLNRMLQPATESVLTTVADSRIQPGTSYISMSASNDDAFDAFLGGLNLGRHGLCVTRQRPDTIRQRYKLEKTPIIWLTTNNDPKEICIDPLNIPRLSQAIQTFLSKTEHGVMLISGMEMLVTQNGFRSVINLLYLINDKVMAGNAAAIISMNESSLSPQDANVLKSEFTALKKSDG